MSQEGKKRPYVGRVYRKGRWVIKVTSEGNFFEREIAIEETNVPRGIFRGARVCFDIATGPSDKSFAVDVDWYNGSQSGR